MAFEEELKHQNGKLNEFMNIISNLSYHLALKTHLCYAER